MKLTRRLKKKQRILMTAAAVTVAAAGGAWLLIRHLTAAPAEPLMVRQLGRLQHDVAALPPLVNQPGAWTAGNLTTVSDNMNEYIGQLARVQSDCQELAATAAKLAPAAAGKTKDAYTNVRLLCGDLVDVTRYARDWAYAAKDYIAYGANWPAADQPLFRANLSRASLTLDDSLAAFGAIDNSKVSDPALPEATALLHGTRDMAAALQSALDKQDFDSANRQSPLFTKRLDKDKSDLLNARGYFWKNTVRLTALQRAIQRVKDQVVKSYRP